MSRINGHTSGFFTGTDRPGIAHLQADGINLGDLVFVLYVDEDPALAVGLSGLRLPTQRNVSEDLPYVRIDCRGVVPISAVKRKHPFGNRLVEHGVRVAVRDFTSLMIFRVSVSMIVTEGRPQNRSFSAN